MRIRARYLRHRVLARMASHLERPGLRCRPTLNGYTVLNARGDPVAEKTDAEFVANFQDEMPDIMRHPDFALEAARCKTTLPSARR